MTGLTAESKDVVATVLYTKNPAPTPEPKPEPQPQPQPEPEKSQPVKQEPAKPGAPVTPQAPALPETGENTSLVATLFGGLMTIAGLGLAGKRKKKD